MDRLRQIVDWLDKLASQEKINPSQIENTLSEAVAFAMKNTSTRVDTLHNLKNVKEVIHYTSLNMLISMLCDEIEKYNDDKKAGGFMRMYDSFHLNDPTEGQYLTKYIKKELLLDSNKTHAYVASFIIPRRKKKQKLSEENNLRYWFEYGKQGAGCSIRFPIQSSNYDIFRQVLYGEKDAKRSAKILTNLNFTPIRQCLSPLTKNENQAVCRIANKVFSRELAKTRQAGVDGISYLYKDEAYIHEQECRAVKLNSEINNKEICFDYPRHYFNDNKLSINEILVSGSLITIGPRVPHKESVRFCIDELLERVRQAGSARLRPEIIVSEIPYQ